MGRKRESLEVAEIAAYKVISIAAENRLIPEGWTIAVVMYPNEKGSKPPVRPTIYYTTARDRQEELADVLMRLGQGIRDNVKGC